tara:strand:+ start:649 stop:1083 length:435 start_codon:yes stop_codon:yes gene_type:complete
MKKTIGKKFFAKRQARKVVFSALYATLITGTSIEVKALSDVSKQFEDIDLDYARLILQVYIQRTEAINALIDEFAQHSKRGGNTDVERAILQMAVAEMYASDIENRIVINEAIEIAKEYGSDDGYKFINAVLDKIAKKISGVDD